MKKKLLAGLAVVLFIFGMVGMVNASPLQWSSSVGGNDHWYDYVSFHGTWDDAYANVQSLSYNGLNGHLATLTSSAENAFVWNHFSYNSAWLGGYQIGTPNPDNEPDGNWAWVTGETWNWTNWSNGEPNDQNWNEDHLQFWDFNGTWNDMHNNYQEDGYIVEYEQSGTAPVPEPGTVFLLGLGLAGLVGTNLISKNR